MAILSGLKNSLVTGLGLAVLAGAFFGCGGDGGGNEGGAGPTTAGQGGAGQGGAGQGGAGQGGAGGGDQGAAWSAVCEAQAAKFAECGSAQDPGDLEECKAQAPCFEALYQPAFLDALRACFETVSCTADNIEDGCYASAADKTPSTPATTDAQAKCDAKVTECGGPGGTFKDDFCADMNALNDDVATAIAECTSQDCEAASTCASEAWSAALAPCGGK